MNAKLSLETYKTLNRTNKYFRFIEHCRKKKYGKNELTHIHHIIPVYVFKKAERSEDFIFLESAENKIRLSIKDHWKAHELLFEIYGNQEDQAAKNMLSGNTIEAMVIWRVLGAQASHDTQRNNNKGFWNSETQKKKYRKING